MVPKEIQEATDSLPKAQSKSGIAQLDGPGIVASTNVPEILTASDCQERLPESSEDRVCDTVMPPASNSQAASTELPLNVVEDPASTLDIQGSARSDQGAQSTGSPPFSSVLAQNITTAAEHWTSRSASSVNHSEDVHEGGGQPPNISYSGSTVNASQETSLPNPRLHFPSFSDICDYELEKLSKEQGTLRQNFEETTSELKAELERKMAEARSEYDRKSQEVDTEYNANAKKIEAFRTLVAMNSLLANAFKSSCPVKSAATDTAAVRVARSSQHSTQQQQAVQTNTHMNSTAPPQPSVTTAESPIPSGPLSHFPHCNTPQPRPISQQAAVQSNLHMNSTALPRPSVTAEAFPLHSPRCNTPQPRPISQLPVVQSNTHISSTAPPGPSVTSEAIFLHSPPCNMLQPRPPPLISNHTPSSYSAASEPGEDEGEAEHVSEEISPLVRKNPPNKKGKQTEKSKGAEELINYRQEFDKIGFKSTCYPDMNTAEKLGISKDVESLIAGCGLAQYMSMPDVTYPEAAAEFLATVRYFEVKGSLALLNSMGGGFITFQTNGVEYTCTLKEIQDYFGFSSGKPNQHSIAKEEQNRLWELLTRDKTFENGAKGSKIKSPTVAYVRRAIAETLYSRDKTGPCSAGDFYVLIGGLKAVFIENPKTREVIDGDRANVGLAFILAKQLESYRGKISSLLKRGTGIAKLSIGGPITRILRLAGVEMDFNAEHYEPALMDIDYLRAQRLLTGPKKDPRFYYRLHLEDQTETRIALPNKEITSFEVLTNVMFTPSEELFIDPECLVESSDLPDIEQAGCSSSARKKKGTPAVKEKMLKMVPCLMTKEQRDELKAEIRAELKEEIIKEVEEKLTKKWARKMKEHFEHIERHFVRKPSSALRPPTASTKVQQQRKPASGGSSSSVPPRHPSSESGSKRPSGSSGSEGRQKKVPRQRSPPEGDKDSTPPRRIPPIRLNISPRNWST